MDAILDAPGLEHPVDRDHHDRAHLTRDHRVDLRYALGERHLWLVMTEFTEHYHRERNHQGLENRLIEGAPWPAARHGPVRRQERLGGILNYYYREAV